MTKAVMNWDRLRLEVNGHANWDEVGKDIVCAAESMLVQALWKTIEEATARKRCEMGGDMAEGQCIIWAEPKYGYRNEIKNYFKVCVVGLKMLAEEYPKYIEVWEV